MQVRKIILTPFRALAGDGLRLGGRKTAVREKEPDPPGCTPASVRGAPAHAVIIPDITADARVELIAVIEEGSERFYAISVGRRLKHPAVLAIVENARRLLFARSRTTGPQNRPPQPG